MFVTHNAIILLEVGTRPRFGKVGPPFVTPAQSTFRSDCNLNLNTTLDATLSASQPSTLVMTNTQNAFMSQPVGGGGRMPERQFWQGAFVCDQRAQTLSTNLFVIAFRSETFVVTLELHPENVGALSCTKLHCVFWSACATSCTKLALF